MNRLFSKSRYSLAGTLVLVTLALCAGNTTSQANEIKQEYIMGIFPHLPPRELEKVFSPMAADLSKIIGKPIIFRTSSTYHKFMQQLDQQVFDIAFVQPFDYIRVADKYGYRPLATREEKLSAIIVTKKDSPLKSIDDLKNKTIALPPKVAAVSLLVKNHAINHHMKPGKDITLTHHRSHISCMQQVLIGSADACGTAAPALRFFQHKMKTELKIISESKAIPHTLFVIHPRVPEEKRDLLRKRLLNWAKTETGKQLLARGRLKPLRAINDSDYNIVRSMSK